MTAISRRPHVVSFMRYIRHGRNKYATATACKVVTASSVGGLFSPARMSLASTDSKQTTTMSANEKEFMLFLDTSLSGR
jgi:hypothetical protein